MTGGSVRASGELLLAVEPEDVTAGGVGFVVIAGLVVGTVFLLRSMNKQLKKVDFEEAPDGQVPDAEAPDRAGPDAASMPDEDTGDSGAAPGDRPEEGPRSSRS